MKEDPPPPVPSSATSKPISPPNAPPRRSLTVDESSQFRHRPPNNRFSTNQDASPSRVYRRRSSNFSDYSLKEARKSFASSTDSLLLPKASGMGEEGKHESSHWDSAPLAFALLPAVGGMLFTNGSSVVTDIMLLGLAAIFLNWSVRLPWDWYHSAQEVRKRDEYTGEILNEESDTEEALSFSQATLEEVPEEELPAEPVPRQTRKPALEKAANELHTHETLALLSCFLFPLLGAYLLHTIRSQLSRPSEGLVSDYNLTIFLLASEIRPLAHTIKLIQARTLHLQRIVSSSTSTDIPNPSTTLTALATRLTELENLTTSPPPTDPQLTPKQSLTLTTEVRRTLQPELDALNRAVRRYEKRATLQAFQTDSRLQELEARLNDAISLAAAATYAGSYKRGFTGVVIEWVATGVVVPVQVLSWVLGVPGRVVNGLVTYGKMRLGIKGRDERGKKGVGNGYGSGNGSGIGNGRGTNGKVKVSSHGMGKKAYEKHT